MTDPNVVQLYLLPGSSSPFPHILLRYCSIPFTPQIVRPWTFRNISTISDKQQVPVLVLDGRDVITENPAIAHAINRIAPEKQIFGRTSLEFVRVCEWLAWIAGPLHAQAWSAYIRPARFTTEEDEKVVATVKESARHRCLERYATLESRLHPIGPWALGEHFTAVDAYVLPFHKLARSIMKLEIDAKIYPRWTRVVESLRGLDAVNEALRYEHEAAQEGKERYSEPSTPLSTWLTLRLS